MIQLVTCQLMVGKFKQPGRPRPAVDRQDNLKQLSSPLGLDGHIRGMRGGIEGGRDLLMHTHTPSCTHTACPPSLALDPAPHA